MSVAKDRQHNSQAKSLLYGGELPLHAGWCCGCACKGHCLLAVMTAVTRAWRTASCVKISCMKYLCTHLSVRHCKHTPAPCHPLCTQAETTSLRTVRGSEVRRAERGSGMACPAMHLPSHASCMLDTGTAQHALCWSCKRTGSSLSVCGAPGLRKRQDAAPLYGHAGHAAGALQCMALIATPVMGTCHTHHT